MYSIGRRISLKIINILAILSFILITGCSSDSDNTEKKEIAVAKPAKLFTVSQVESDEYLNYPAVIQSTRFLSLAFQVSGIVKEVSIIESEAVKKGQVLAKLDQRDHLAQLNSAKAQFKNAETEYLRAKRLIEEQAISRSVLDQRKSQFDITKAQLDTAQKAFNDTILVSPFSGNIATVSIEALQNVQAGEAVITVLGNGGLEAKANLPSNILARAEKNGEKNGSAFVILDADRDRRIPAKFKSIALEADSASQTFEVIFDFKAPENLNVLPGMNATLWFRNPDRSQSGVKGMSVPLAAISIEGNENFVWVVDPSSNQVSKRKVVVQKGVGSHLTIIDGLEAGEIIVAAGVSQLSAGMEVRPWSQ